MSNKLESYIQSHLEERKREKPDPAVLGRILKEMKSNESDVRGNGIVRSLTLLKWAAACLFFALCFIGVRFFNRHEPMKEITKLKILPDKESLVQPPTNPGVRGIVRSAGKEDQIFPSTVVKKGKTKRILWYSGLNNMESAAKRINAIFSSSSVTDNNIAVIDKLMSALNNDPNASVRLAAIDALKRFYGGGYANRELIASLKSQLDPVVQINLIALFVQKRELNVLPDLIRMINDEKLEKSVKDYAYSSILQLRPEITK
jgi:hypothetical protein